MPRLNSLRRISSGVTFTSLSLPWVARLWAAARSSLSLFNHGRRARVSKTATALGGRFNRAHERASPSAVLKYGQAGNGGSTRGGHLVLDIRGRAWIALQ